MRVPVCVSSLCASVAHVCVFMSTCARARVILGSFDVIRARILQEAGYYAGTNYGLNWLSEKLGAAFERCPRLELVLLPRPRTNAHDSGFDAMIRDDGGRAALEARHRVLVVPMTVRRRTRSAHSPSRPRRGRAQRRSARTWSPTTGTRRTRYTRFTRRSGGGGSTRGCSSARAASAAPRAQLASALRRLPPPAPWRSSGDGCGSLLRLRDVAIAGALIGCPVRRPIIRVFARMQELDCVWTTCGWGWRSKRAWLRNLVPRMNRGHARQRTAFPAEPPTTDGHAVH
jgi:hypothetical protein